MPATEPIRIEHALLRPRIEELRTTADVVDGLTPHDVRNAVDRAHELLVHHVLPHAKAEDRVLYPEVERLMGAPGATAAMTHDHRAIGHLAVELEGIREGLARRTVLEAGQVRDLRRVLYGLHALLLAHLAKEEDLYLPLLDGRLTSAMADALFEAMHHAELDAKAEAEAFAHDAVA